MAATDRTSFVTRSPAAAGEHREALEDKLADAGSPPTWPWWCRRRRTRSPRWRPRVSTSSRIANGWWKRTSTSRFKDPDDQLRIVFVCAMWLTGFDAPATSTIYLDKPMRNHTLMQTIARANRVFQGKQAGEIIDYIGVFRNLQEALALYGSGSGGGVEPGDLPVEAKEAQAEELAEMLAEIDSYARQPRRGSRQGHRCRRLRLGRLADRSRRARFSCPTTCAAGSSPGPTCAPASGRRSNRTRRPPTPSRSCR